MAPLAGGQDFPIEQIQEEIGKHRVFELLLHGLAPESLKLDWLPKDLEYPKGKVSLVPDHKDRHDGRIIVYLINDTEVPVSGGLSTERVCLQEVLIDDKWNRSSVIPIAMCANCVEFKSGDLSPGHAAILLENDPSAGELNGTLRYYVNLGGTTVIASAPLEGKFRSEAFEGAAWDSFDNPSFPLLNQIPSAPQFPLWKAEEVSRKREEIVASLELQRHYDRNWSIRQKASGWADTLGRENVDEACRKSLREVLAKPWKNERDELALFQRCREALEADPKQPLPYGAPERCKAAIWKYLAELAPSHGRKYCNPERLAKLDAIKASGNPWGVPHQEVVALATLAVERIKSSSPEEQIAAGRFLQRNELKASHFPDKSVFELLQFDSPVARKTSIAVLMNRGNKGAATAWLKGQQGKFRGETRDLLPLIKPVPTDLEDWEIQRVVDWLNDDLDSAVRYLSAYSAVGNKKPPLPVGLRPPILRYLEAEANNPTLMGAWCPSRDENGVIKSQQWEYDVRLAQLTRSMKLLSRWREPSDIQLLHQFLRHPASMYGVYDNKVERYYLIRERAKEVLLELGRMVPPTAVFMETLPDI